jgi:hypothetical protein
LFFKNQCQLLVNLEIFLGLYVFVHNRVRGWALPPPPPPVNPSLTSLEELWIYFCRVKAKVKNVQLFFILISDLSKIQENMQTKSYKRLVSFVADVSRIFNNCRLYNPKDSSFYRCAEVVERFFVQKLNTFKVTKRWKMVEVYKVLITRNFHPFSRPIFPPFWGTASPTFESLCTTKYKFLVF